MVDQQYTNQEGKEGGKEIVGKTSGCEACHLGNMCLVRVGICSLSKQGFTAGRVSNTVCWRTPNHIWN